MRRYVTAGALLLGAALVAYPVAKVGRVTGIAGIGAVALIFLTLALTWQRARSLVVPAAALVGLHYALTLHVTGAGADAYALAFGAGLFVLFEAADVAVSLADVSPSTCPATLYRVGQTLATAVAGCLVAAVALVAPSLLSGGIALVVVGAACVLGVVALPLIAAKR